MYNEGDIVLLHGLKSKPAWNGRKAQIMGPFQWQQARYPIQIITNDENDSKQEQKAINANLSALIKPSNLNLISRHKPDSYPKESLFEIKFVNNEKRFGMFALQDIISGTVILTETPIITLSKEQFRNGQNSEECIAKQFDSLSKNEQKNVLELHDNIHENGTCVGVYRTNAYMFTDNDSYESGLFVTISRINHACFPNSILVDNAKNGINKIIALIGINKGEEITHSYIDLDLFMCSYEKRQKYISQNYGFMCKCNECECFRKRDEFRKLYRNLFEESEKAFEQMNVDKILECNTKMIAILNKHFIGYPPMLSQAYMRLAEGKLHIGQYSEVVDCMKRSAKMDLKYYGNECDLNDIIQCKIMLPKKFQTSFPWDHVLGNSKPK